MKLLLHTCCGPCLIEPLDALRSEAESVAVLYANPNIHPFEEYERRRDVMAEYAEVEGVDVIEVPYDPALWLVAVGPLAEAGPERCRACFRLRLETTAQYAATHGFDAIATTLTVSPYQDGAVIAEEGESAASAAGVTYVHRDFRERYADATKRSRALGMYRQNYCGCLLSDVEARAAREARRAAKKDASKQG